MTDVLHSYDHYVFAAIALFGTLAACLWLLWLANHSRMAARIRAYRGVSAPFVNVIGVLFALTLAFIGNDTWNAHDRAVTATYQEAGSLRSILAMAHGLPEETRAKVTAAIHAYVGLVIAEEWPALKERRSSHATSDALADLMTVLTTREVAAALPPAVHTQILADAADVRQTREQRAALSRTHMNPLKWLGMAFLGLLSMVSIGMVYVDQPKAEMLAVMLFAAAAAPTAAIVLIQGNPFLPPGSVSPAPIAGLLSP